MRGGDGIGGGRALQGGRNGSRAVTGMWIEEGQWGGSAGGEELGRRRARRSCRTGRGTWNQRRGD